MAQAQPIKTNFTAGELSPRLFGRVDVSRYLNGAALLENFIVLPHGGIIGRPGSRFSAEVKDSSKITRLLSFEFNETDSYIMEFGDLYVRFYANDGAILESAVNITGATQANPCSIHAVGHGYTTGDDVVITGVGGMTQLNGKRFRITVTGADDFTLDGINSTAYTAYTAGGTVKRVYTKVSPYTSSQLFGIQTAQSADVMYLAHASVRVQKLSRTAHTSWTFTAVDFQDGPYLPENTTATTISSSASAVGAATLTASAALFAATDVGRVIAYKNTTTYGWARITAYTSATQVDVTIVKAFDGTSAKTTWKLGAFSDTTGHPVALCFHEQRFWLGGPGARTQTVYGSVAGSYENMAEGTATATDAIVYTIASDKVNPIRWLSPGKEIAIGTGGAEFVLGSGDANAAITPSNIKITRETTYGVDQVPPARIGNAVLFLQRARRKIREFGYKFADDAFDADDITILSEHIIRPGVVDMAYQQEPNSNLWCVRGDGQLATLTYQKAQQVFGWSRSIMGGAYSGGDAVVESVGVIPDDNQDQVWMLVKRTINGQTKRYVEYLTEPFYGTTEAEKKLAVQLDSSLTYNSTATNVVTGADHLVGQTVGILADGKVQPDQVVAADGSITLAGGLTASIITVGLKYRPKVQLLTFEPGNPLGSSQGKIARVNAIIFRVYQSLGGYIGPTSSDVKEAVYNDGGETADQSPPLKSGYIRQLLSSGYTREPAAYYEQRDPLPITILSAMPEYQVNPA
jgi:hypothetical protein